MTLQSSGAISISNIATELGISSTGLGLNDSRCRTLAGVPSGAIALSNFYGKSSAAFVSSFSGDLVNVDATTGIKSASMTFNSDGSITAGTGYTGSTNWYSPAVSGVGSSYYIKLVWSSSGVASNNRTSNQWVSLASSVPFELHNTSSTSETIGTVSVYFSTAGSDATIVKSYASSIQWDLGKAV